VEPGEEDAAAGSVFGDEPQVETEVITPEKVQEWVVG